MKARQQKTEEIILRFIINFSFVLTSFFASLYQKQRRRAEWNEEKKVLRVMSRKEDMAFM